MTEPKSNVELQRGSIGMNDEERAAVMALLTEHGAGSLTRRDPGEQGPVIVDFSGIGGRRFHVDEDGTTSEV